MFANVDKTTETEMVLPVEYNTLTPSVKRIVRNQYVNKQNGRCFYCNNKLNINPPDKILGLKVTKDLFPKDFFKWPVHLHHSHDTGMTIGVVHAYCNAVLWEYEGE